MAETDLLLPNHPRSDSATTDYLHQRADTATADYFPGVEDYIYTQIEHKRKMRRGVTILLGLLAVSLLIASVTILVILLLRVGGQDPRVEVDCGLLEGDYDFSTKVYTFKVCGILSYFLLRL